MVERAEADCGARPTQAADAAKHCPLGTFLLGTIPELIVKTPNTKWFRHTAWRLDVREKLLKKRRTEAPLFARQPSRGPLACSPPPPRFPAPSRFPAPDRARAAQTARSWQTEQRPPRRSLLRPVRPSARACRCHRRRRSTKDPD